MSGYDYGNARLKAMKSRLLTRQQMLSLSKAESLEGLISALTNTAYRAAIETALAYSSGIECISIALRNDLLMTLHKVRTFWGDDSLEMVNIVLRTYDIHNLRSILRGLAQNVAPGEISDTLLPVGQLAYDTLEQLVNAPDPRACIDLLASMNSPFAYPLVRLRGQHPGADTQDMELALEQWHFSNARDYLVCQPQKGEPLFSALRMDADIINLLTVLRFGRNPDERKILRKKLNSGGLGQLLVGPGFLSFEHLIQSGEQENVAAAIEQFDGTQYEAALRQALQIYAQTGRISSLENKLVLLRLAWLARLIYTDPLGIGVLLGYLALKTHEIRNLRWIAQGLNLGASTAEIAKELEINE